MTTYYAGRRLTAAQLQVLVDRQPTSYEAACSSNLVLSTTLTDVTGATITFTTLTASAIAVALFDCDCSITVASAGNIIVGQLNIDGADDTNRQALHGMDQVNRATIGQKYRITLGAAGSHTIKLRGQKTGAGGTSTLIAGHTNLTLLVYEIV